MKMLTLNNFENYLEIEFLKKTKNLHQMENSNSFK